jgi:coenzyme F420-reducing hydrogenase alpha subunit
LIAGRSVHATYPVIGGYLHFPDKAGIDEAVKKLKAARPAILRLIKVFAEAPSHFDRKTKFMALVPEKHFGYVSDADGGKIKTSRDEEYGKDQFREHLEHVVIPYSQASGFVYKGEEYMVGSLARINLAKDKLHPKTIASAKKVLEIFPSTDIYMNNVAQAIEILHSIDEAIDILTLNEFKPEPVVKPNLDGKADSVHTGIGVIEAPRGTLYHKVVVGGDGIVKEGEVVVPTGQNQINIERDVGTLVNELLKKPEFGDGSDAAKEKLSMEIEKLIRAYDPCMSCGSHFLKVEWDEV